LDSSAAPVSGITIVSSEFEQQAGEKGVIDASRRLADKVGTVSSDVLAKNLQSFCEEIGEAFEGVSTVVKNYRLDSVEITVRRRARCCPGAVCRAGFARLGGPSVPVTPPGRRSRRSPCRRLSARVRSATWSSRLSESRRSASEPTSGSTAASRSLREAARARWLGHRAHRSCGRYRWRAP
jgi:hypothetical protein